MKICNLGIIKSAYNFIAIDGQHQATILENCNVRLRMADVKKVEQHASHFVLNTGSPHYVRFQSNVRNLEVLDEGKEIRYSNQFAQQGINVNFVEILSEASLFVRTYERGVEAETHSCGTGVVAASLAFSILRNNRSSSIAIETLGGDLKVTFEQTGNTFTNVFLEGPAVKIFSGQMQLPIL